MNWSQLQAIVWLRWRLSWNRFVRAGSLNAVISIIILASLITGGVAAGIGGVVLGSFVVARQSAQSLLVIWDGVVLVFLMFWLIGLITEIQRAESVDFSKLLHLPLTLRQVFVFNYLASHFTPGIILLVPGMFGLSLGLALAGGVRMALLIPLVISFLFMITAWTYCLRGWLSALMVNKRRRRAIVVWITLAFVLIGQLPAMILNSAFVRNRSRRPAAEQATQVGSKAAQSQEQNSAVSKRVMRSHLAVPLGWPAYGAMTLKQGRAGPALGATALGCFLGMLGLMRSYRTTLKFYQGAESGSPKSARVAAANQQARGVALVERNLPWMSDDTAALALATLRSLLRAPEMKMSLIMPIVAGAAFSSMSFAHLKYVVPQQLSEFVAPAAAIFSAFSFAPIMANVFGLDRNGFRGLVLLPTPRNQILFAKNLAFLPLVGGVGVVLLLLAKFILGITLGVFISGLIEVLVTFVLFSLMCNVVCILTPYRTAAGTLQAKKPKPVVFLAMGITMIGLPLVLWPVAIPAALQLFCSVMGGMPVWLPVDVLASLVLLCAVSWVYSLLLPAQGRLLQRREQRILIEVTEESE